jgi:hypothetical protein
VSSAISHLDTSLNSELSKIHTTYQKTNETMKSIETCLKNCTSSINATSTSNAAALNNVLIKLTNKLFTHSPGPPESFLRDLLKAHNEKLKSGLYLIAIGEKTRKMTSEEMASYISTSSFVGSSGMIIGDLQALNDIFVPPPLGGEGGPAGEAIAPQRVQGNDTLPSEEKEPEAEEEPSGPGKME